MAARSFDLKNMKKFMRNFNDEIQRMRGRTHKGLINAAIVLQREAEPMTPLDIGNLRASWFVVSYKSGQESDQPQFEGEESSEMTSHHQNVMRHAQGLAARFASPTRPVVLYGYSANYAPFVHENVGASFGRPTARARWLFAALQRSKARMLEEIRKEAEF